MVFGITSFFMEISSNRPSERIEAGSMPKISDLDFFQSSNLARNLLSVGIGKLLRRKV